MFPEAVLYDIGIQQALMINNFSASRQKLAEYGDTVPSVGSLPCHDGQALNPNGYIVQISCLARKYNITIVINTLDVVSCEPSQSCPFDAKLIFNTNVSVDFLLDHTFYRIT